MPTRIIEIQKDISFARRENKKAMDASDTGFVRSLQQEITLENGFTDAIPLPCQMMDDTADYFNDMVLALREHLDAPAPLTQQV